MIAVWQRDEQSNRNSLHGYIHKLRRTLRHDPTISIINQRGFGYMLVIRNWQNADNADIVGILSRIDYFPMSAFFFMNPQYQCYFSSTHWCIISHLFKHFSFLVGLYRRWRKSICQVITKCKRGACFRKFTTKVEDTCTCRMLCSSLGGSYRWQLRQPSRILRSRNNGLSW